jgi:hypothetical protein
MRPTRQAAGQPASRGPHRRLCCAFRLRLLARTQPMGVLVLASAVALPDRGAPGASGGPQSVDRGWRARLVRSRAQRWIGRAARRLSRWVTFSLRNRRRRSITGIHRHTQAYTGITTTPSLISPLSQTGLRRPHSSIRQPLAATLQQKKTEALTAGCGRVATALVLALQRGEAPAVTPPGMVHRLGTNGAGANGAGANSCSRPSRRKSWRRRSRRRWWWW